MPRSCSEMTRERRASFALAPALRITWASPREMPYAAAGSIRASMQVTSHKSVGVRRGKDDEPTAYFFAGGRARLPCVKLWE